MGSVLQRVCSVCAAWGLRISESGVCVCVAQRSTSRDRQRWGGWAVRVWGGSLCVLSVIWRGKAAVSIL